MRLFSLIVLLCFSLGVSAYSSSVVDVSECEGLTLDNYQQFIANNDQSRLLQDPFHHDCVLLTYKSNSDQMLKTLYRSAEQPLITAHQSFLKQNQTAVLMLTRPSDQQRYTFFHYNMGKKVVRHYEDKWYQQKTLRPYYADFFFLHEVIHLDADITRNPGMALSEKEAISDIGAVLLIASKYQLEADDTAELMRDIYRARATHVQHFGEVIQRIDKDHFNKRALKKAIKFFEKMDDEGASYHVASIVEARDIAKQIVTGKSREQFDTAVFAAD